tara:strand:+ start:3596 stop:4006 length:411 start_codon:yes stop_codon:yes gene_type:complete
MLAPLSPLQNAIAGFEAGLLGLARDGNVIGIAGGLFVVSASCTGLVSASVLAAIIFSLKKPVLKKKLVIFATGAIALFLLNLVRVYIVLLVAINFGSAAADLAHTISWFSTAALILAAWYLGMKKLIGIKDFSELM